jgi:peptidyl-tRNA hydrolase
MSEELIQYYIVNEDLVDKENNPVKMSGGKLAVQVAHVATEMAYAVGRNKEFKKAAYFSSTAIENNFDKWYNSDLHKKIILRAHEKIIDKVLNDKNITWCVCTRDAGLTEIKEGQLTVVALPPCYKSDLPKYIQRLQLYRG